MEQSDALITRMIIAGRVQGVGYRWFAYNEARRLGVRGWARNLEDGRVEVVAGGAGDVIARFREALRRGPPAAHVTEITEAPAAHEELPAEFEIATR